MPRKSPAASAKAALEKLLAQRNQQFIKLAQTDAQIAELRESLGMPAQPPHKIGLGVNQAPPQPVIPEEPLSLPEDIAPGDNMGPGRFC